jgi:hypothetical protein
MSWRQPTGGTARDTGNATAGPGGFANTGLMTGPVSIGSLPVARSVYRQQVQRIAPPELADRDLELVELAEFCTASDASSYVWWQAGAWAGKSALMSWFVLHPPAGVRLVPFFITARWAGQSDRIAFTEVVTEQLAELLSEPMPALTDATRDLYFLDLLGRVAEACDAKSERLVLLVDGLDEDRGVTLGPDSYSIAALLPAVPPAGMRVIIAGRPNPPIPPDVPDRHPLRDPAIIRRLAGSAAAMVVRQDMLRELTRLLRGDPAEQDLLGLLAAAGGGLSAADLAELTEWPVWDIDEHLATVAGRSFSLRASRLRPGIKPDVYVLGHEELQNTAVQRLGPARVEAYRRRLHIWADGYEALRWPPETPEYLLRGYYRMLDATDDLARMVACATDAARHDRMLDLIGGDSAALAEIAAAQEAVFRRDHPDLFALARLAVRRDRMADRNSHIPPNLPGVWAALGRPARAEALARSISHTYQAQALAGVAGAVAAAGDCAQALVLADQAEALAQSIQSSYHQAEVLAGVAGAVAAAGEHARALVLADQAETLAESNSDRAVGGPDVIGKVQALVAVAGAVAAAGDHARAQTIAQSIRLPDWQARALATVAGAAAAAGDHDRAMAQADQAETLAQAINIPEWKAQALAGVAWAVAVAGDYDRALAFADQAEAAARSATTQPRYQAQALAAVAGAVAAAGDHDRAEALADQAEIIGRPTTPLYTAETLTAAARAVAVAGDYDRALALADQAEILAQSIADPRRRANVLAGVAEVIAVAGDYDRALAFADQAETAARLVTDSWGSHQTGQAESLAAVVRAVAAAGDHARAEAIAQSIPEPYRKAESLAGLAGVFAAAGDHDRALALADQAEQLIPGPWSMTGPYHRDWLLTELISTARYEAERRAQVMAAAAEAAAAAGDHARAEATARAINTSEWYAKSLAAAAEAAAAAGNHAQADALAFQGEAGARTIPPLQQAQALAAVARAVAAAGDHARAEAIAQSIPEPYRKAESLAGLAGVFAAAGDHDRALALADQAEILAQSITESDQVQLLAAVARAVAAAGDHPRAEVLADQAETLARSSQNAYILAVLAEGSVPSRGRRLVAEAFRLGRWTISLNALSHVQPDVLAAVADEIVGIPESAVSRADAET